MNDNDLVYFVTKNGIMSQTVIGLFTKELDAKKIARFWADEDSDDWHTYCVHRTQLNIPITLPNYPGGDVIGKDAGEVIWTCEKGDGKHV